ncbi:MAG: VWA domain-containing protein [Pyrinomonadaceae bacterium]
MRFPKFVSLIVFLFLLSAVCFAQDDEVINVDSAIVRLNVGVVNRSGQPIKSLSQSDFAIYEDGVKQEIVRFAPTAAPFSVVMILDMSGSTLGFRETISVSALRFIDALAPDDRVAIIEFYDKVNLLNDFTNDRKVLLHSIGSANGRGKTQLYKALDLSLKKLAKEENRRKAVIVLTDGVDTSIRDQDREFLSKLDDAQMPNAIDPEKNPQLNGILNNADALGVTIFPLALPTGDPAKLADPLPIQVEMFSVARSRLKLLADRTGGTLNAINRLEEMGKLYAQVAADVRSLYTIEYQPQNDNRDGKWREIKIEVNRPELISRTRPGYFAK